MKKIMIAAALVCASTLSYGVALNWQMTGLTDSVVSAAQSGYFVEVASMDVFNAAANKYDYVSGISSKTAGTMQIGRSGTAIQGTHGEYAPGDAINGFIIVFDDGNVNYAASTMVNTMAPAAGTPTISKDFIADTAGWQSTTSSVPEPTSGLLLLLGVAGMALKRKRA